MLMLLPALTLTVDIFGVNDDPIIAGLVDDVLKNPLQGAALVTKKANTTVEYFIVVY